MSKILIVEDDQDLRDVYRDIFTDQQFEVATAVDGNDAMAKVLAFAPDVILLDLIMPHTDGFQLLQQLKANEATKNIKVIIMTNVFADTDELMQNGAIAVWLKTDYTPKELVDAVNKTAFGITPTKPSQTF
jgi:DNA-binding response OmpR family regulator